MLYHEQKEAWLHDSTSAHVSLLYSEEYLFLRSDQPQSCTPQVILQVELQLDPHDHMASLRSQVGEAW